MHENGALGQRGIVDENLEAPLPDDLSQVELRQ